MAGSPNGRRKATWELFKGIVVISRTKTVNKTFSEIISVMTEMISENVLFTYSLDVIY